MSRTFKKVNADALAQSIKTTLDNKYYNLYLGLVDVEGLEYEARDFIFKELWCKGTIASYKPPHFDEAIFDDYAVNYYNMYDFPSTATLINRKNMPFIPNTPLTVNQDVVIGWAQANHKPVKQIVDSYIDRIVEVERTINTNLATHKIPWLINVDPAEADKAADVMRRILNDDQALLLDTNGVKPTTLATNTPYIIDKLYQYRTSIENELMTYLGLDNAAVNQNSTRLIVDQVNANNELINASKLNLQYNLQTFFDKTNELFGTNYRVVLREPLITAVEEDNDRGGRPEGSESEEEDNAND